MKNKLIPLLAFVLLTTSDQKHRRDKYDDVIGYTLFLKQSLNPGMFTPCDEDGNVLEKPSDEDMERFKGLAFGDFSCDYTRIFEYIEAKERVLFEDWKVSIQDTDNGDVIYDFEFQDIEFSYNKSEDVFMDSHGEWLAFSTIEDLALLADVMGTEVLLTELAMNKIKS